MCVHKDKEFKELIHGSVEAGVSPKKKKKKSDEVNQQAGASRRVNS